MADSAHGQGAIGILQPAPFFGAAGGGDTAQVLFRFVALATTGLFAGDCENCGPGVAGGEGAAGR